MYHGLLTLAWFVGTIYATIPLFSLVVRWFGKRWRGRESPLQIVIPSWFIMIAGIYFMTWPWNKAALWRSPVAWLFAMLLFGMALSIYQRSRRGFRIFDLGTAANVNLAGNDGLSPPVSVNESGIPFTSRIYACCSPGHWARVKLCCTASRF